jgi:pyridoxal phosphate enzyme (YggS family)
MSDIDSSDAVTALDDVRTRIAAAAGSLAASKAVTLIAVSKTVGVDRLVPVIAAGQRHFGENRIQEAMAKWPDLRTQTPDLTLHLIGPLQTNKAAEAVGLFDVIHTVDRPKLAEKLAAEMTRQVRRPPCFVQVNTGLEAQKAGVLPAEADAFIAECRDAWKLPIVGLMCVPPVGVEPSPHFAFLREIARRNGLAQLSMGMSGDYEIAVGLGATHVRVGSAIFGAR